MNNDNNDIDELIAVMKNRVKIPHLHDGDLNNIVWELVERVLNATNGEIVKNSRRQSLVRVNTITFRTELAVKSETK